MDDASFTVIACGVGYTAQAYSEDFSETHPGGSQQGEEYTVAHSQRLVPQNFVDLILRGHRLFLSADVLAVLQNEFVVEFGQIE